MPETNVRRFIVKAAWEAEAGVWYVAESDVPGLAAEGETMEDLITKLRPLVTELLALNTHLVEGEIPQEAPFLVEAQRLEYGAPAV